MKFQLALDTTDLDQALMLAAALHEQLDIIEVGPLLMYAHGIKALTALRSVVPQMPLLADMKIVDRGKDISQLAFQSGADWVTVLAGTGKSVIHVTTTTAHNLGKRIMLDLIDASSPGQSALEALSLGVDALLFHKPADDDDGNLSFLDNWDMVRSNTKLPIFIAAPISSESASTILSLNPDGIVIDTAMVVGPNPGQALANIRALFRK
jgi:3-hexulose-6-phosphate synthase